MNESEQQKEDVTTPVVPEVAQTDAPHEEVETVVETAAPAVASMQEEAKVDEAESATPTETAATTVALASVVSMLHKTKDTLVRKKYTVATFVAVLIALLVLVYALEAEGKLSTGVFDGVQKQVSRYTSAATVNNEKISEYDLGISVTQLSAGAVAQGADIEDPAVKAEIRAQALDMLINTELLKQEAVARGIEVPAEDVTARLETLKTEVGGEDVLNQRMKEFGINQKTLLRDIKNEITIQKLLDQVFVEKPVTVSEEEIVEFYEQAGGVEAKLPALAEVRAQIETQLKATKEQGVVTAFIEELRGKATIEKVE